MIGHGEHNHIADDDEVNEYLKGLMLTNECEKALDTSLRHVPFRLQFLLHHQTLYVSPFTLLDRAFCIALHLFLHAIESLNDYADE